MHVKMNIKSFIESRLETEKEYKKSLISLTEKLQTVNHKNEMEKIFINIQQNSINNSLKHSKSIRNYIKQPINHKSLFNYISTLKQFHKNANEYYDKIMEQLMGSLLGGFEPLNIQNEKTITRHTNSDNNHNNNDIKLDSNNFSREISFTSSSVDDNDIKISKLFTVDKDKIQYNNKKSFNVINNDNNNNDNKYDDNNPLSLLNNNEGATNYMDDDENDEKKSILSSDIEGSSLDDINNETIRWPFMMDPTQKQIKFVKQKSLQNNINNNKNNDNNIDNWDDFKNNIIQSDISSSDYDSCANIAIENIDVDKLDEMSVNEIQISNETETKLDEMIALQKENRKIFVNKIDKLQELMVNTINMNSSKNKKENIKNDMYYNNNDKNIQCNFKRNKYNHQLFDLYNNEFNELSVKRKKEKTRKKMRKL